MDHLFDRYRAIPSRDGKFGAQEPDGSWNGMVAMILDGEVEMGVGSFYASVERETVTDFSFPMFIAR